MAFCVPIKDMKDTAAFSRTVEESFGPVTVTKNGYDAFVVMKSADYQALQEELAKARLLARIAQAEHEYAMDEHAAGEEFISAMRAKYDL